MNVTGHSNTQSRGHQSDIFLRFTLSVSSPTFTKSFQALILAQFLSALADHALLLVCIALLTEHGYAAWWVPLIKAFFTLSYIFLAPWVGLIADRWPKPQIMRLANGIKVLGCCALLLGLPVPFSYALIGLGAALYAPAKYGWITEVVPSQNLVRANGWIEVSTVGAAIMGVAMGGFMLSPWMLESAWVVSVQATEAFDTVHAASLLAMLLIYAASLGLTKWVTPSEIDYPHQPLKGMACLRLFFQDQATLWRDTQARVSLSVTTLFWGLGGVIQLLVLQWAQLRLQIAVDQAAYLQASTGLGVIVGAWLAGRFVPLHQASRVLGIGVLLGIALPALNWIDSQDGAWVAMVSVGLLGGLFVVPMNAMLQHRGVQLLTAGRSIAVQNFNENSSVFIQVGCYSLLLYSQIELDSIIIFFGLVTALAMLSVIYYHWRTVKSAERKRL